MAKNSLAHLHQEQTLPAKELVENGSQDFEASKKWLGERPGFVFKRGKKGSEAQRCSNPGAESFEKGSKGEESPFLGALSCSIPAGLKTGGIQVPFRKLDQAICGAVGQCCESSFRARLGYYRDVGPFGLMKASGASVGGSVASDGFRSLVVKGTSSCL